VTGSSSNPNCDFHALTVESVAGLAIPLPSNQATQVVVPGRLFACCERVVRLSRSHATPRRDGSGDGPVPLDWVIGRLVCRAACTRCGRAPGASTDDRLTLASDIDCESADVVVVTTAGRPFRASREPLPGKPSDAPPRTRLSGLRSSSRRACPAGRRPKGPSEARPGPPTVRLEEVPLTRRRTRIGCARLASAATNFTAVPSELEQ
jgi:hypothetical protein